MGSFLVIIEDLELTSPNMLYLGTKHLIMVFDYTPCPRFVRLSLFSPKQDLIIQNL